MTKVIGILFVVGITVGAVYLGSHLSANCYDFWPFKGSACVVTTK